MYVCVYPNSPLQALLLHSQPQIHWDSLHHHPVLKPWSPWLMKEQAPARSLPASQLDQGEAAHIQVCRKLGNATDCADCRMCRMWPSPWFDGSNAQHCSSFSFISHSLAAAVATSGTAASGSALESSSCDESSHWLGVRSRASTADHLNQTAATADTPEVQLRLVDVPFR